MTNEEAKAFLDNLKICINEHPVVADWLVEIANRKTENCSEKPNNCETQTEGVWNAGFKTGYDKGYKDAQKVKDSQDLVKNLVKAFCEDGTWLERQGVYTLTLAEAKQRAVDIIESVTQTETQNSNLTFEKDECAKEYEMCVTDRLSEVDTMALHAHENIRILQRLRYKQLVNDSQGVSQAEQTEPQYDIDKGTIKCDNCSENGSYKCSKCDGEMYFKRLEVEDEPQTENDFTLTYTCSFSDCENFKHFGFGEKCIECKRKQSEVKHKDEPQTDWKDEMWTEAIEDEPQTEEWYTYQDEQEYNDRWQTDEPRTDCSWKKGE